MRNTLPTMATPLLGQGGAELGRVGKYAVNALQVLRQGFGSMEECKQHNQQQRRVRAAQS